MPLHPFKIPLSIQYWFLVDTHTHALERSHKAFLENLRPCSELNCGVKLVQLIYDLPPCAVCSYLKVGVWQKVDATEPLEVVDEVSGSLKCP